MLLIVMDPLPSSPDEKKKVIASVVGKMRVRMRRIDRYVRPSPRNDKPFRIGLIT